MANRVTASDIALFSGVVPAIGFIFSLSYEYAYFSSLGIPIIDVMGLTDIVKGSALRVLPALPLVGFAIWIGASQPKQEETALRAKSRPFDVFVGLGDLLFVITCWLIVAMYWAFGVFSTLGVQLTAIIFLRMLFRSTALKLPIDFDLRKAYWVALIFVGVASYFFATGKREADRVKFGQYGGLPKIEFQAATASINREFLLLRNFSTGHLFIEPETGTIYFSSGGSVATIYTVPKDLFRGILCGSFDICPPWYTDNMRIL
ncbi:MAG: hypothetical protein ACPGGK_13345 [Pikeienuella sp.]